MTIIETRHLALDLMQQHGLTDWNFQFDYAKRRFGFCNFKYKLISLSYNLVQLNSEEHVKDTILHEIAHALAGNKAGHGYMWIMTARKIGANPARCYDSREVITPEAPYTATCSSCGHLSKRFKRIRPGRQIACGYCCKKYNYGRFTDKFLLTFEKGVN